MRFVWFAFGSFCLCILFFVQTCVVVVADLVLCLFLVVLNLCGVECCCLCECLIVCVCVEF